MFSLIGLCGNSGFLYFALPEPGKNAGNPGTKPFFIAHLIPQILAIATMKIASTSTFVCVVGVSVVPNNSASAWIVSHDRFVHRCFRFCGSSVQSLDVALSTLGNAGRTRQSHCAGPLFESAASKNSEKEEEWSDFDDLGFTGSRDITPLGNKDEGEPISNLKDEPYVPSDDDKVDEKNASENLIPNFAKLLQERSGSMDWTAIQSRQFSLGQDLILSDYVGNMGFDEVTDWEYYYPSDEDDNERQVVQPNPFDASK